MNTAILAVWWVALIGAIVLIIVMLKLVFLIIRAERDILELAQKTAVAARGIAANTSTISKLETAQGSAVKIASAAKAIESNTASIEQKLRSLGRKLGERRR